jgi:hypothetical protein
MMRKKLLDDYPHAVLIRMDNFVPYPLMRDISWPVAKLNVEKLAFLLLRNYQCLDWVVSMFGLLAGMIGKKMMKGKPTEYTKVMQMINFMLLTTVNEVKLYLTAFRSPDPMLRPASSRATTISRGRVLGMFSTISPTF